MPSHQVDQVINELGEYEIPEFRSKQWELETEGNSVADFLDTQLIPIAGCKTRTKDIYDEYKTFCMETGQKAVAMNKFSSRLLTVCSFVGWEAERGLNRNGSYMVGVDLREEVRDRNVPTPSEVFKQAEKVDSDHQPSQPSQPDGARDSAFTLTFTQPSQPSQPSPTENDSGIATPSPEREGCVKADVKVDVKAGTQSGQGRESCEGSLPNFRTGDERTQTSLPKKGDRVYVPLDGQWELVDVKQVHKKTFSAFRITQYDRETLEIPIVHGLKEWRPEPDPVYIYESARIKDKKGWVQGWHITRIDRTHYHCRLAGVNETKAIGKREVSRSDLKFPDWVYQPVGED
ncbi:MAG: hypothetical protein J7524_19160 [Roseofilum sp. Belize BBD 4]|uniref:primase-like DNA-binding domain-containing protein n=1 Tax=Roseofilum sp. Belize BBD 4 TaxID=2821500 RepID=UPI001B2CA832|nr:primase-like DNA-binding domain-containing protein [Roseofilum sp. Belize BBD 4]MBP0035267.1 hypothetical protein [Roseofilum sp. Belize BBD 4]